MMSPHEQLAPIASRVIAFVADSLPPSVAVVLALLLIRSNTGPWVMWVIVSALLVSGWAVLSCWAYGKRCAGLGYRMMGLRLVSAAKGEPIGWGRAFLRGLVYWAVSATGVGWVAMLVSLVVQVRHQGWHDLAASAVAIRELRQAPSNQLSVPDRRGPSTVSLPDHLLTTTYANTVSAPLTPSQGSEPSEPIAHVPGFHGVGQAELSVVAHPGMVVPAPRPQQPVEDPFDYGRTRMTQSKAHQVWMVQLDNGTRAELSGLLLIGRNPGPRPGEQPAGLLPAGDPDQTISRTHLAVGLDENGPFVCDRGSTNGTSLLDVHDQLTVCLPDTLVRVREGQVIRFGERTLTLVRAEPSD